MKNKIISLALVLLVLLSIMLPMTAFAETEGAWTYTVANDKATITEAVAKTGDIIIPSTLGGYPVTAIDGSVFIGCTGLTSITLPDSITSIKDYTFSDCTGLTSITLPASIGSIGNSAFSGCTGLTSITLSAGIMTLSDSAFSGCTSLTSITLPDSIISIGKNTFSGCTGLTSVKLSNRIMTLSDYVFSDCTSLTSITLPNSVTRLGNYAFYDCASLTSITLPASITNIGSNAFYDCTNLTAVTILNPTVTIYTSSGTIPIVTKIIGYAGSTAQTYASTYYNTFEVYDASSQEYTEAGWTYTVTDGKATVIASTATGAVTVPTTLGGYPVTGIGDNAFIGCTGLTSVTVPDSITSIGDKAFSGCTDLTTITISNPTVSIYDSPDTIPATTKIIAPTGSTAQAYATTYGHIFEAYTSMPDPDPDPTQDPKEEPTQDSDLIITGTIQPTIVSFGVPAVINFTINPNGTLPAERFICPDFNIKNTCQAPLTISVKSFALDAVSAYKGFQDVLPTDVTDWSKLNAAETKSKLALGLTIRNPAQWHGTPKTTPTYSKETLSAENILLGTVDPASTVNLSLTACHGNAFDCSITATYKLVFIFDLAN